MPLVFNIVCFFVVKGLLAWPFYASLKAKPLLIGFFLALAEAPLLALLYHDTDINFWIPFFSLLVFDMLMLLLLLEKVWWKAIVVSFVANFIGFIMFFLFNG